MNNRFQSILILLSLTLFSLFVIPGYSIFIGDHYVYIPHLYKSLAPTLYKNDFSLQFKQDTFFYFDEIMLFFLRNLSLDIYILFFLFSFIFRFLAIYALYALAHYFTRNTTFSLFSPLLFFFPQPVFGTVVSMFEPAIYPRFVSLTFSLLFLVLFFRERFVLSALFLSFAILIHPLTALPFFLFFVISCFVSLYRHNMPFSSFLISLILPTFVGFFSLLSGPANDLSLFTQIDPLWKTIIQSRISYVYVTLWHYPVFFILISYLLISFVLLSSLHKLLNTNTRRFHVYLLLFIPVFLTLFSFFTVDILDLHFLAELQLGRSLLILRFLVITFFSYFAYDKIISEKPDFLHILSLIGIVLSMVIEDFFILLYLPLYLILWIKKEYQHIPFISPVRSMSNACISMLFGIYALFFILLLVFTQSNTLLMYLVPIAVISLLLTLFFYISFSRVKQYLTKIMVIILIVLFPSFAYNFSIYPQYFKDNSFMETCNWIKQNTSQDALFITDPFSPIGAYLRMTCLRSVFVTNKDGAASLFQKEYALEWQKRMFLLNQVGSNMTILAFITKEYKVDYIISETSLQIPYSLSYANDHYFIYDLKRAN